MKYLPLHYPLYLHLGQDTRFIADPRAFNFKTEKFLLYVMLLGPGVSSPPYCPIMVPGIFEGAVISKTLTGMFFGCNGSTVRG
jgi:hypothetical protein